MPGIIAAVALHVSHAVPVLIPSCPCIEYGSWRFGVSLSSVPLEAEAAMERFIHNANIAHYRHLIAESERDPARDEDRHRMLLTLLAEEIAKENKPGE
jgi:hypothetical protein